MTLTVEEPLATKPSYTGLARVLDLNGMLLDVGKGEFAVVDPDARLWQGTIRVFKGSCLAPRSLTCLVELADGRRLRAQVGPMVSDAGNDLVAVKVVGIDPASF